VIKILNALASRTDGDAVACAEEGQWLLTTLPLHKIAEMKNHSFNRVMSLLANSMAGKNSPRANYYRGRALLGMAEVSGDVAVDYLTRSAEAGFAPAMAMLGWCFNLTKWQQKSVQLNDPDGLYTKSRNDYGAAVCTAAGFEYCHAAAIQGHVRSLGQIVSIAEYRGRMSPIKVAKFSARFMLYTGDCNFGIFGTRPFSLDVLYVAGRELEGYEQLWDEKNCVRITQESKDAIQVYVRVTERARRAALQTVAALLRTKCGRDVARLIGQLVYGKREQNVEAWWRQQQKRGLKKIKMT
jgi:hypothetical protein